MRAWAHLLVVSQVLGLQRPPISRRNAIQSGAAAAAAVTAFPGSSLLAAEPSLEDSRTTFRVPVGEFPTPEAALQKAELYAIIPDSTKRLSPSIKPIKPKEIVQKLAEKRAVFLGEHHNSPADHLLQAAVIRQVHETAPKGRPMAVGLEAVQRRFQPVLDDYVAGRIGEAELEERTEWKSRWFWPFRFYLPVFQTCRELGVPLLALNVDSEDLSKVESGGLPALPQSTLDRYITDRNGFASFASTVAFKEYVAYIIQPSYTMHQRMGILKRTITGQTLDEDMTFRNFFSGRILWDEAMASASAAWCEANPTGLLIGLVGSDHVKFGCGVPARCARQLPGGLATTAAVLLNPRPIDTRDGQAPPAPTNGLKGADGKYNIEDYVLQLRFAPVAGDGGPPVIGSAPSDVEKAAQQRQARNGQSVLPLADYIMFGGNPARAAS